MIYQATYMFDVAVDKRTDTGLSSLDEVVEMFGEPLARGKRYVIYGTDENKTIFSDVPLWGMD